MNLIESLGKVIEYSRADAKAPPLFGSHLSEYAMGTKVFSLDNKSPVVGGASALTHGEAIDRAFDIVESSLGDVYVVEYNSAHISRDKRLLRRQEVALAKAKRGDGRLYHAILRPPLGAKFLPELDSFIQRIFSVQQLGDHFVAEKEVISLPPYGDSHQVVAGASNRAARARLASVAVADTTLADRQYLNFARQLGFAALKAYVRGCYPPLVGVITKDVFFLAAGTVSRPKVDTECPTLVAVNRATALEVIDEFRVCDKLVADWEEVDRTLNDPYNLEYSICQRTGTPIDHWNFGV
ncbi:MAG TPA: hypothetical protein VGL56_04525 [Fimbriimonadaceae bacterium]|jgi:hypothetical protein